MTPKEFVKTIYPDATWVSWSFIRRHWRKAKPSDKQSAIMAEDGEIVIGWNRKNCARLTWKYAMKDILIKTLQEFKR